MRAGSARVHYVHAADGARLAVSYWDPPATPLGCVLLLHGLTQNRKAYLRGHLPSVLRAAGFAVLVPELRGHGSSANDDRGVPGSYLELDLPAMLQAASELFGAQRPHLVGHSLGGMIGYAALARRDPGLASVVGLGAPISVHPLSSWPWLWGATALPWVELAGHLDVPIDVLLKAGASRLTSSRRRYRPLRWLAGLTGPGMSETEDLRAILAASEDEPAANFRVLLKQMVSPSTELFGVPVAASVRDADVPVGAVIGDKDFLAPMSTVAMLEEGVHHGPRSVAVVRGAGHIDLTASEASARAVTRMIRSWVLDSREGRR